MWSSISIYVIGLILLKVHSEVVIVNVYGNTTNEEKSSYKTCGLFRSRGEFKPNVDYDLYDLNLYTYCSQYDPQNDSSWSFMQNAVFFMPTTPFDCSFKSIANNLLADGASLGLIGTDGPINFSYVDPTNVVGLAFFPKTAGENIQKHLEQISNPRVVLNNYTNQFDPSILIVLGLALVTVIAIAEWNLYKFKKRLGQRAKKIKIPTSNNPDISSLSRGLDGGTFTSVSNHPSINELPLPPDDRLSPNQTQNAFGATTTESKNFDPSKTANKISQFVKSDALKNFSFGYITIGAICVLLVGLVLLVYFFYPVMVWVISALFAILACLALFSIGEKLIGYVKFLHFRIPENKIPLLKKRPKILSFVWLTLCVAFCAIWFAFRRTDWAWIFQDIMVLSLVKYALSFNMFRSYHVVIVLLTVICIYETFMIFILPLFAQRATIFTAVAFGFKTSYDSWYERPENKFLIDFRSQYHFDWLPLYLIIPNTMESRKICSVFLTFPYTVLGIGDILVPAISLNYALIYDVASGKKFPIFFFLNLVGFVFGYFIVGLIGSFVTIGLPPMLFLAPIQIAINILVPFLKKDLQPYLNGETISEYSNQQINQLLN